MDSVTNLRGNKLLLIGLAIVAIGISLFEVGHYFLSGMEVCTVPSSSFNPGNVVVDKCNVIRDVGQNLTLKIYFFSSAGGKGAYSIRIPAHAVIIDPSNKVLFDKEINSATIFSFRPQMIGTYRATITNLQKDYDPVYGSSVAVYHDFGFLVNYPDVDNPFGNSVNIMPPLGSALSFIGIAATVVGVFRASKKSKIPNNT